MFSSTKSLFAAIALLAVLPGSLAQTTAAPAQTGTAEADQRRVSACAVAIETPGFNNEYNYLTSDTSMHTLTYTYDYNCKLRFMGITSDQTADVRNHSMSGYPCPQCLPDGQHGWHPNHLYIVSLSREHL